MSPLPLSPSTWKERQKQSDGEAAAAKTKNTNANMQHQQKPAVKGANDVEPPAVVNAYAIPSAASAASVDGENENSEEEE